MFQSARIKLTCWYLLIIMVISIAFSVVIYQMLKIEVERFDRMQRARFERRVREIQNAYDPRFSGNVRLPSFNPDLVYEIEERIFWVLFVINAGIFTFSGLIGYFLAGKTLLPIKEMVEEQNRFITDSSHELRTPLTSLKSTLEVSLLDKNLSLKEARDVMEQSIDEANKLQSLTDELLQLSQHQKTKIEMQYEKISLKELGQQAIQEVQSIAKKKRISIVNNLEDIEVSVHLPSLREAIVILLDNAIKYSAQDAEVILSSKHSKRSASLIVTDQGVGIEPKDLPHIFDRFYRADSARTKSDRNGYGLGLSIAKRTAQLHNGSITVASTPGKGSTFTLSFPRFTA